MHGGAADADGRHESSRFSSSHSPAIRAAKGQRGFRCGWIARRFAIALVDACSNLQLRFVSGSERVLVSSSVPDHRDQLMPNREEAWELLCEYTKGDSLRKHALAVETAMRACAPRYGGAHADVDEWGLVGLLHDFDYEMFPSADQHPFTGSNI